MGRDKVLGLSLAILVIGLGGAFCFRNEQVVRDGLQLARAKLLDEVIAERSGPKPYADLKSQRKTTSSPTVTLQGIESFEAPSEQIVETKPIETTKTASQSSVFEDDPQPVNAQVAKTDESTKPPASPLGVAQSDDAIPPSIGSNPNPAPADVDVRPNQTFEPPTASIGGSTLWQTVVDRHERETVPTMLPEDAELKTAAIVHRVRRGDTLSRIAQQYLGDGSRYFEIYAANRDRLRTPDDRLRLGMMLRIPRSAAHSTRTDGTSGKKLVPYRSATYTRSGAQSSAKIDRSRSQDGTTDPVAPADQICPSPATGPIDEGADLQRSDRFVPARRSPFQPTGPESSSMNSMRGRRLSQRPPANDPGADAVQRERSISDRQDLSHYQYFSKRPSQIASGLEFGDESVVR